MWQRSPPCLPSAHPLGPPPRPTPSAHPLGPHGRYVLLRKAADRTRESLGPVSFLFWVDVLSFVLLVIWALAAGEMNTFVNALVGGGTALSALVFGTACLGGVRFLTEINAVRCVAPSTPRHRDPSRARARL